MNLTVYMFGEEVVDFFQALKRGAGYEKVELKDRFEMDAEAYVKFPHSKPLGWARFFAEGLDFDPNELRSSRSGLVLFIRDKGRVFAFTAGMGFAAIDREKIEYDFGLKVALNKLNEDMILAVDTRKIDLKATLKREVSSFEGRLEEFDIDKYAQLLGRIAGKIKDDDFGTNVVGSDSLKLTDDLFFADLPDKVNEIHKLYLSETYKEMYPFVDNLKIVKGRSKKEDLFREMQTAIANIGDGHKIILATPDIDSAIKAAYFEVKYSRYKAQNFEQLDPVEIFNYYSDLSDGEIDFKKCRIRPFDSDGFPIESRIRLQDYLIYEADIDGGKYIFTQNKWYHINGLFVQEVEEYNKDIEIDGNCVVGIRRVRQENGESFKLLNEAEYNKELAEQKGYACLDQTLFQDLPGFSKVELCDLFDPNGKIIHIKKYDGSSVLSHLFSQATVSATLIKGDERVAKWLGDTILDVAGFDCRDRINSGEDMTVVFGIVGMRNAHHPSSLPFFSQVNLMTNHMKIKSLGFKVELAFSDVTDG